jgi:hypothetical protein
VPDLDEYVDLCGCGRPVHYEDPRIERFVRSMIARKGPCVLVQVEGEDYGIWVPRHYIALHGLRGEHLVTLAALNGWKADV